MNLSPCRIADPTLQATGIGKNRRLAAGVLYSVRGKRTTRRFLRGGAARLMRDCFPNPSPRPPPRSGEGETENPAPLSASGRGRGGGVGERVPEENRRATEAESLRDNAVVGAVSFAPAGAGHRRSTLPRPFYFPLPRLFPRFTI